MTETWTMGGYRTDTLTGKVAKIGNANGAPLNNSGVCFQVAGANYQVTAGKTFYMTGYLLLAQTVNCALDIRYADNAALTTNPVILITLRGATLPVVTVGMYDIPVPIFGVSAPAGKYVGIFSVTAADSYPWVWMYGYEV
jgi:hypothetical protein